MRMRNGCVRVGFNGSRQAQSMCPPRASCVCVCLRARSCLFACISVHGFRRANGGGRARYARRGTRGPGASVFGGLGRRTRTEDSDGGLGPGLGRRTRTEVREDDGRRPRARPHPCMRARARRGRPTRTDSDSSDDRSCKQPLPPSLYGIRIFARGRLGRADASAPAAPAPPAAPRAAPPSPRRPAPRPPRSSPGPPRRRRALAPPPR